MEGILVNDDLEKQLCNQEELIQTLLETARKTSEKKEELFEKYTSWHREIWNIIITLLEVRDNLKKHSFRSKCANLSGTSATILGSIAAIAGIALMPVTAGTSLALTIGGSVTASTGGVVSIGSTTANYYLSKQQCARVNEIFETHIKFTEEVENLASQYGQLLEAFQSHLDLMGKDYFQVVKFLLYDCIENLDANDPKALANWCPTISKMEEMKPNDEILTKIPFVYDSIIKLIRSIVKDSNLVTIVRDTQFNKKIEIKALKATGGSGISTGTVIKTVSDAGRLFMFSLKEAGMAIRVGLGALNALFLIWGLFDLVKTSVEIHRGSETDQTKEITKVVRDLKQYRRQTKLKAVEIFGSKLVALLD